MRTEVSANLTAKQIYIYLNACSSIPGDSILHCMKCVGIKLCVENFFNLRISMDIIFGLPIYTQDIYTYTHNSKHPFVCLSVCLSRSLSLKLQIRYIFGRKYVNLKYCYYSPRTHLFRIEVSPFPNPFPLK
jgi:hypothetical protein